MSCHLLSSRESTESPTILKKTPISSCTGWGNQTCALSSTEHSYTYYTNHMIRTNCDLSKQWPGGKPNTPPPPPHPKPPPSMGGGGAWGIWLAWCVCIYIYIYIHVCDFDAKVFQALFFRGYGGIASVGKRGGGSSWVPFSA